jgi:hypothetical protein
MDQIICCDYFFNFLKLFKQLVILHGNMEEYQIHPKIEEFFIFLSKNIKRPKDNLYKCAILLFDMDLVNFVMYDKWQYIYVEEETEEKIRRIDQNKFRTKLIELYEKCK